MGRVLDDEAVERVDLMVGEEGIEREPEATRLIG